MPESCLFSLFVHFVSLSAPNMHREKRFFKCDGFRNNSSFIDRVNIVTKNLFGYSTVSLPLYTPPYIWSTVFPYFSLSLYCLLHLPLILFLCSPMIIISTGSSSSLALHRVWGGPLTLWIWPLLQCLSSVSRGPAAPWFPHHRHGPTVESGGANTHCHHALCRQWQPRPWHLLVQRLPPRQHHQQQWPH